MKKLISHHSEIYYALKDICHFYKIIDMYFSDPQSALKFTMVTKQGHKEVDSSQVNTLLEERHKHMPEPAGKLSGLRRLNCHQTKNKQTNKPLY